MARRTKQEAMETRARILESALDIFCGKNYSTVTIEEIAEKAKVTKGAVYWHFKSKNDILMHILDRMNHLDESNFIDVCGPPKSIEEINSYYKKVLTLLSRDTRCKKIHMLMFRKSEWPEQLQDSVDHMIKSNFERERKMLAAILLKAQQENKIRTDISPDDVSIVLSAVLYGLFILQLSDMISPDFALHTDFLYEALKKELTAKASELPN